MARHVPGIPGLQLPPERRPEPTNPPPPESIRPAGEVKLGRGRWSLSMPSVVALALIASVGGFATAWLNKPNAGDPAVIIAGWRAEQDKRDATRKDVDDAITTRLGNLELEFRLQRQSIEGLRDAINFRNPVPPSP